MPSENIGATNDASANGIGELISIACVAEEKETIKRHVKLPEISVVTEREVVGKDAFNGPDKTQAILALNAIGLGKKFDELGRKLDLQTALGHGD